jgi:hypothetical protein
MSPGKPIAQRSGVELIGVFVVLPILLGGLILLMVVSNAVAKAGSFTLSD